MTIDEFAKEHNLTCWSTSYDAKGKSYTFMDDQGINVIVNEWDKSFALKWLVPRSIFTVECPTCSPYDHPGHFEKLYNKFINVVEIYKNFM